jgi:hypothetical protein
MVGCVCELLGRHGKSRRGRGPGSGFCGRQTFALCLRSFLDLESLSGPPVHEHDLPQSLILRTLSQAGDGNNVKAVCLER